VTSVDSRWQLTPPVPVLVQIRSRLEGQSETAALDAQVLLAHLLGKSRAWVIAHPELVLTLEQSNDLEDYLARLEMGEPLPYVLGHWEFYGLDFGVTPATLIPRPETELLVARAIEWLRVQPRRRLAVDVGTGTGCIAVSLAAHISNLRCLASDISIDALRVARDNIHRHGVQERVACLQTDLLPAAGRRFDLICANLPYIPTAILQSLPVARWEPSLALDGGPDGLDQVQRLLSRSPLALAPGGQMLLEIEATQGPQALELARLAFPHSDVTLIQDMAGRDRLICIQT
jgi:release factor glutamine methyltransferase